MSLTSNRKITGVICTTPIRPIPTSFPPLGSMAIIQALSEINVNTEFYNIDFFRPSLDQVELHFKNNNYSFVGISAVVSTAYEYTRELSNLIKRVSPSTVQILGGNLAASAEVVLRKTHIDFCVLGDGENIMKNLISLLQKNKFELKNKSIYKEIKGLTFLNGDEFVSTSYATPPTGSAISFPDYSILEKDGSLSHFIGAQPGMDEFTKGSKNTSLITATVVTAKGCVARCTFCHRWEKGFRSKSKSGLIAHIEELKHKYNVGAITVGDENFGSDKDLTSEFATAMKNLNIFWSVSGVRARTVTPDNLKFWKTMNCNTVIYGIESGSQTMLDVMQKNTTVEMNSDALKWTHEASLYTVLQFVIGMPGECDRTILETQDFVIRHLKFLKFSNGLPSSSVSINYAQALPGTPLYEYAIREGLIESGIIGEENYLLKISDLDAYSTDHFVNYTKQPLLKVLLWRYLITAAADEFYVREILKIKLNFYQVTQSLIIAFLGNFKVGKVIQSKFKLESYLEKGLKNYILDSEINSNGYFNFKGGHQISLLFTKYYKRISYITLAVGMAAKKSNTRSECIKLLWDHLYWSLFLKSKSLKNLPTLSLRKEVFGDLKFSSPEIIGTMQELRMGR